MESLLLLLGDGRKLGCNSTLTSVLGQPVAATADHSAAGLATTVAKFALVEQLGVAQYGKRRSFLGTALDLICNAEKLGQQCR